MRCLRLTQDGTGTSDRRVTSEAFATVNEENDEELGKWFDEKKFMKKINKTSPKSLNLSKPGMFERSIDLRKNVNYKKNANLIHKFIKLI